MRVDYPIVAALVLAAALWIEHGHRIVIETPPTPAAGASVCPDNDSVPYSASCVAFMEGDAAPQRQTAPVVKSRLSKPPDGAANKTPKAPCADNDNVPYRASCLDFLSGWYWQAHASELAPVRSPR